MSDVVSIAKVLSSATRVQILRWLADPAANFRSRRENDLGPHGVCVSLIAHKAGLSQPTASEHLAVLSRAGLVSTTRVAQWNYHHRDESGLSAAAEAMNDLLLDKR